ncbi:hypothetical protein M758_10G150500 [Ceratodon purpureus]|uniref:Secreted protein n=1 Tax=Ceratodon purpureus TaxID=3225 RepID=A0A8T0GKN3_CERPU|nr:hypothetical protein KC19_10G155500 [Ceratodon purpureus]KAG0604172.1 hypothetical protein M758_10G150500 [Ceratodon purpureus]
MRIRSKAALIAAQLDLISAITISSSIDNSALIYNTEFRLRSRRVQVNWTLRRQEHKSRSTAPKLW